MNINLKSGSQSAAARMVRIQGLKVNTGLRPGAINNRDSLKACMRDCEKYEEGKEYPYPNEEPGSPFTYNRFMCQRDCEEFLS